MAQLVITATLENTCERSDQHLILIPKSDWALWRWIGLRGAGFPVGHVLNLAAPESAALADRLIQAADQATPTADSDRRAAPGNRQHHKQTARAPVYSA